jgi:lysophospholipase L1-like esterase
VTRGRRLGAYAAVALLGVVVGIGLLEVTGRLLLEPLLARYSDNQVLKHQLAKPKDLGIASLYVPHHYYLYAGRPAYRSDDGAVRHNGVGCRAEDVPMARRPGVTRIVTVGGSTTYSTLVRRNEDVYTYRLQALLTDWASTRGLDRSFEVINCGVPGSTSAENLSRYIFALSEYRPDLLVVQQGINDALPRALPHVSRDYREFAKTWDEPEKARSRWFVSRLLRAARNRFGDSIWTQGVNFLVRRPFWDARASGASEQNYERNTAAVFDANTRYLVRLGQHDGAEVLLMTEHLVSDKATDWRRLPPGRGRATLEHNALLETIARDQRTLFLDLQAALCACPERMPDGRHLNEQGEGEKAQAIFEYLTRTEVLERWLPARRGAS